MPAVLAAEVGNLVRVGSDDDVVELRARARGFVDVRKHRTSDDVAKDFARQAGGGETCGDDGDGFHWISFRAGSA